MTTDTSSRPTDLTAEGTRMARHLENIVAFRFVATAGALSAAIAPAVMATADGATLRGSVSDYWNIDPRYLFWAPFTVAAVLLFFDGVLSYMAPNRSDVGSRWYHLVLGVSLAVLTWFDKDNDTIAHFTGATIFFVLFIAVIAYTSALGWIGRHVPGHDEHDRETERVGAKVSMAFLLLLLFTLAAWLVGLLSFFFFELFALVNFALFYVKASIQPFPTAHYEFPADRLNQVLRTLRIMR